VSDESPYPLTADEFRRILDEALAARARVDAETHRDHHDYVAALIERDRERAQMYRRIQEHIVQWGIIGVLSGIVWLVWYWFSSVINPK
jgi:hypothetical protein